jgi:hypothetical protein
MSTSLLWNLSMIELPGVIEDGMPGRNVQRKPGTARGSPRRSRTAKASRFARLLKGLTIAVGNRKNRILFYQFLAAEIRALHYSYGVGDSESYKRALTFLEECERFTLRSLMRKSAERHVEVTVDHAKRVFVRALKKLNASPALAGDLEPSVFAILPRK